MHVYAWQALSAGFRVWGFCGILCVQGVRQRGSVCARGVRQRDSVSARGHVAQHQ